MNYYSVNKKEEREDRLKSGIITAIIWSALLLFVFLYSVKVASIEEKEQVSTMLINFGDNRNGNGEEEPANQEGSLAASTDLKIPEPITQPEPEAQPEPVKVVEKEETKTTDKVLTGNNTKTSVKKTDKTEKILEKTVTAKNSGVKNPVKNTSTKAEAFNSKTGSGDGQGNAAIGNLLKGKGTKPGTQGTGGTVGNAGDPLGGEGNGDSRIGVDRKLTGFIPGTMGRGGAQPNHDCTANGSITISYTVDKSGKVASARRQSGNSDPCVMNTAISWVKQYVKAEAANVSSKGTYKIVF